MSEPDGARDPSAKTVLIVDDDPGTLHVLSHGLGQVLGEFEVLTASDGSEAVKMLEQHDLDVLVTDLAMPVMDGFALIAYVTNRRQALPVVVLSALAADDIGDRLAPFDGLRVLRKPISYRDLAACLHEVLERSDLGQIEGIALAGVAQLIEAERRTCTVVVASGRRRGRLYFESGKLINAFSDDFGSEGEAAAYDILGWPSTTLTFEPLPDDTRRLVHTPMRLMLLEVAVVQDQLREHAERALPPVPQSLLTASGAASVDRHDTGDEPAPAADAPTPDVHEPTLGVHEPTPDVHEPTLGVHEPTANTGERDAPGTSETTPEHAAAPLSSAAHDHAASSAEPTDPGAAEEAQRMQDDHERFDQRLDDEGLVRGDDEGSAPEADTAAPSFVPEGAAVDGPLPPASAQPDAHVAALLGAMRRLSDSARVADAALAAVASEVEAFREAQQRFDAEREQRERRRRELETFQHDVAKLAREILARVERMFDPRPQAAANDTAPAGADANADSAEATTTDDGPEPESSA